MTSPDFSIRAREMVHNNAESKLGLLPVTAIHGLHPTANVAATASLAYYPAGGGVHAPGAQVLSLSVVQLLIQILGGIYGTTVTPCQKAM